MTITCKELGLNGLTDVQKLNSEVFDGMYESKPYGLDVYQQRLSGKKPLIYGAFDGKKLIGAAIGYDEGTAFYVWTLAVLPNYRGRGIGRKLLSICERYARENKFKKVTTKAYDVSNAMQNMLEPPFWKIVKTEHSGKDSKWDCRYYEMEVMEGTKLFLQRIHPDPKDTRMPVVNTKEWSAEDK